MIVPILGGSAESRAIVHSVERTVNWYPEINKRGKGELALLPMPGCRKAGTIGSGPLRGAIMHNGNAYIVSGNEIWRTAYLGQEKRIGIINSSAGPVSMASNGIHVGLVDQTGTGYLINMDDVLEITDADFEGSKQVVFLDGYFIVNRPSSGSFYISGAYDGTSWNALDYATAEFSPDYLVAMAAHNEDLWLFGEYTTEIFYNSGNNDFTFSKRQGTTLDWGCAAQHSVQSVDNELIWLSQSKDGWGQVIKSTAYQPKIISSRGLEERIAGYTLSSAFAFTLRWRGHNFYVLTFPADKATHVWDAQSGEWFEWSTYGLGRHLANAILFVGGTHYVGDYRNGNVYTLESNQYTDDGLEREHIRVTRHISKENKNIFWRKLELDMEKGTGNASESDPQAQLRVSDDGGRTFHAVPPVSIGKIGEYHIRQNWYRLGASRDRVFEIRSTDPVFASIVNGYAEIEVGAW